MSSILPLGGAAKKGFVATALFWALTTSAQAQLLAYESFNYTVGSGFANPTVVPTTATGFADVLGHSGTANASAILSGSLNYTDGNSVSLATSNNHYQTGHGRLVSILDLAGTFASYLESGRIGANGSTLYMSFVLQKATTSNTGYSAFELYRTSNADSNRVISLNTYSGQPDANFHLTVGEAANGGTFGSGSESAINDNLGFTTASATFFVIRFDFGSGTDAATIYANPLLASEPGTATGQISASDLSFDRIAIASFTSAPAISIDEIRVGTTYLSVATAVPEPATTAALLGAATLALAALRRRTQIS
jgi:hypothetical protein